MSHSYAKDEAEYSQAKASHLPSYGKTSRCVLIETNVRSIDAFSLKGRWRSLAEKEVAPVPFLLVCLKQYGQDLLEV